MMVYFDYPGPENTISTIRAAKNYAENNGIDKIIVASITGNSAITAAKILSGKKLICVTTPKGLVLDLQKNDIYDRIEGLRKIKKNLKEKGLKEFELYMKKENENNLKKMGVKIVRGAIPLFSANFSVRGFSPSNIDIIGKTLELFSRGTQPCAEIVLMAADAGAIKKGELVVSIAGAERGLDTCYLMRASNTTSLFDLRFMEIIAKPREMPAEDKQYLR